MANASIRVQRIYKNASGEILRIDTIWVSGITQRTKTWVLGERETKIRKGFPVHDYGEIKFHANPLRIDVEIFQTTSSRTVAEVEMIGSWSNLDPAPDHDYFDWTYGRVDISHLPGVGDTV